MQLSQAQVASRMDLTDSRGTTDVLGVAVASWPGDAAVHKPLSCDQRIREAVFLCFSESCPHQLALPHTLSDAEWRRLLHWLDTSGLALYFLDRMTQMEQRSLLPRFVIDRLERNLEENRQRTQGLIGESIELQRDFQAAGLSYAVLKGISLHPASVTRPELRHQFDIDFLVAESSAPAARQILERHGYTLYAISGKSWEFKKGQTPRVTAKDLYRDLPYRGVELHLEAYAPGLSARLHRSISREICGIKMPVLSPIDLFLGQALHTLKDIGSPFLRASHLLEFYRHVLTRSDDNVFWRELRIRAQKDRRACLAIGIATYLLTSVWGSFAPRSLTSWTMERLPPSIQLWLYLYGRSAIFQCPPGSKLHLLLQQELEIAGGALYKPMQASLLPSRLPPAVIQAAPGEAFSTRIARYRVQIRFLASRVLFHAIEGLRFAVESRRWRRLRNNLP